MRFHIFTRMIVLKTEPSYLYYILQFFHKNLVIKYNLEDFKDRIRIKKKIASKGGEYKNWDKKKMSKHLPRLDRFILRIYRLRLRIADEEFYGQI